MPLLVFFLIWYGVWGQNNPKAYHKLAGKLPKIIIGLCFLSAFSSVIPGLLIAGFVLAAVFSPFLFFGWLLGLTKKGKKRQQKSDYDAYQRYYQNGHGSSSGRSSSKGRSSMTVTGLTRSVSKREKFVQKFNKKYGLNLTEAEIDRIVDASYYSNCWEREIYDMSQNYDAMSQWYNSDTGWLRAYLHAFPVQNVTSDFDAQRDICLDSFKEVFDRVEPEKYASIDDCVEAINDTYYTNFDEATFMIAYRFLEKNGKKYKLPHLKLARATSALDALQAKYDNESLDDLQAKYDREQRAGAERRRM